MAFESTKVFQDSESIHKSVGSCMEERTDGELESSLRSSVRSLSPKFIKSMTQSPVRTPLKPKLLFQKLDKKLLPGYLCKATPTEEQKKTHYFRMNPRLKKQLTVDNSSPFTSQISWKRLNKGEVGEKALTQEISSYFMNDLQMFLNRPQGLTERNSFTTEQSQSAVTRDTSGLANRDQTAKCIKAEPCNVRKLSLLLNQDIFGKDGGCIGINQYKEAFQKKFLQSPPKSILKKKPSLSLVRSSKLFLNAPSQEPRKPSEEKKVRFSKFRLLCRYEMNQK